MAWLSAHSAAVHDGLVRLHRASSDSHRRAMDGATRQHATSWQFHPGVAVAGPPLGSARDAAAEPRRRVPLIEEKKV
jgi:hypothetical protein